ncbi:MAG TPA: RHS repeat-associated core domain-containing protein, partial [Iamia sp.]
STVDGTATVIATETYGYDASGSLTETVTTEAGGPTVTIDRGYDASGQLASTVVDDGSTTTTTDHLWEPGPSGLPVVVDEYEASALTERHDPVVTDLGTRLGVTDRWYGYDALGDHVDPDSTPGLVDGPDTYDPWGNPTPSGDVRGRYRTELVFDGLVHLRAREYEAASSQFTSPDPLDGVPGTPTVANPYHYGDNDPLNKVDPTGLRPSDEELAVEDCADLQPLLFGGEAVWDLDGVCYITPVGVDLNDPCLANGLGQNTADLSFAVLDGISLGAASAHLDTSRVCQSGFETFVGEQIGDALTGGVGRGFRVVRAIDRASSIWGLLDSDRGRDAEELLIPDHMLLTGTFPVIDGYDLAQQKMISLKTYDLTARTYSTRRGITKKVSDAARALSRLHGLDALEFRNGAVLEVDYDTARLRELLVGVEPGAASLEQRWTFRDLEHMVKWRGVTLNVQTVA